MMATNPDDFWNWVIKPIKEGDGDNMPSAFQDYLYPSNDNQVQIWIMTPVQNGEEMYPEHVGQIIGTLTDPGAPWAGMAVTKHYYQKPAVEGLSEFDPKYRQAMMNFQTDPNARGRAFIEYDNRQTRSPNFVDDPSQPLPPEDPNPPAIWRIFMESDTAYHEWTPKVGQGANCGNGNRKRDGSCSLPSGSPGTTSSPVIPGGGGGGGGGSITPGPTPAPTSASSGPPLCMPAADPDAGPGGMYCICGSSTYSTMSSTPGTKGYDPCGYTAIPDKTLSSSATPVTTTLSDGDVVRCASGTYYNYAVNTVPECAGPTTLISTITSLASAYSASTSAEASRASASSASAADASWSSAAASPSAQCWLERNDGWGDLFFLVGGINGWAGEDGESLKDQEDGCGILSGWEWHTGRMVEFDGRQRETEWAVFGLSFVKSGCVERAIKSAGGPDLSCQPGHPPLSSSAPPSASPSASAPPSPPVGDAVSPQGAKILKRKWQEDDKAAAPEPTRTTKEAPTHAGVVGRAKVALSDLL